MLRVATFLAVFIMAAPAGGFDWVDPTRPDDLPVPATATAIAPVSYSVNAIFVSDERRVAIINGERVRIGDRVGAVEVIAIEKEGVTLRSSNGDFVVTLR